MEDFVIDRIDFQGQLECANKIHVLIVDFKQLEYTQHLISDLLIQDHSFDLTVFEQCADEKTIKYMNDLKEKWYLSNCKLNVVFNSVNAPLNHIWNWFYENTNNPYLAILNNDIEICNNFISDAVKIFEKEEKCGYIIHPTNRKEFTKSNELKYEILDEGFLQGWDFIIKREAYSKIPDELWIWSGDNYILQELLCNGYEEIYDISSPILHYCSTTINSNKNEINIILKNDFNTFSVKYKKENIKLNRGDNKYTSRKFIKIYPIDLTKKIIVSFTSWEKKIGNIPNTIKMLMEQTKLPDKIILNLSQEEFKGKEYLLNNVKKIEQENPIFEINMVDGPNTKVWKKWLPIIDKYSNDLICPVDDDIVYPNDFIESLYNVWLKNPYKLISGDKVRLGEYLQCHCGAGSLIFRSGFGVYMYDYKNLMNNLNGDDVFYSFCSFVNGYKYIESNMDVLKFGRINEFFQYSKERHRKVGRRPELVDFEILENFYLKTKNIENNQSEIKQEEQQIQKVIIGKKITRKEYLEQKHRRIMKIREDIENGRIQRVHDKNGKLVWKKVK